MGQWVWVSWLIGWAALVGCDRQTPSPGALPAKTAPAAAGSAVPATSTSSAAVCTSKYDLSHLTQPPDQRVAGPIQDDEAVLLYGLVKVVRPNVIVEFGTLEGYSARNFLAAADPDARVYTYDFKPAAQLDARHVHYQRDLATFDPADVDHQLVGLVFYDAHDLEAYQRSFRTLVDSNILDLDAYIVVHDTGTHAGDPKWRRRPGSPRRPRKRGKEGGIIHQQVDRAFVNWIKDTYPQFEAIHFHSRRFPRRHGLTILQRHRRLETE